MGYHPLVSFVINFLDTAIILRGIPNFLYNRSLFGGIQYTGLIVSLVLRFLVAPVVPLIISKIGCRVLTVLTGLLASVLFFLKPLFPENGIAEIMIFGAVILLAFPAFCSDLNAVQHPQTSLGIALSGKIFGIFIFTEKQRLFGVLSFGFAETENLFILYAGLCLIISACGAFIWSPSKEDDTNFVQDPVLNPNDSVGDHSSSNELSNTVMRRLRWINILVYIFFFPDTVAHLYTANPEDALHWGVIGMYWIFFIVAAIMPIYIGYLYNRKQKTKALSVFFWSFPIAWAALIFIPIIIAIFFTIMLTIFEEKFATSYFTHAYDELIGSAVLAFLILVIGSEFVTLSALSQVFKPTSKLFTSKFSNLLLIRGAGVFLRLILFNGIPFLYRFLFVQHSSERDDEAFYRKLLLAWNVMTFILEIFATIKIVLVVREMIVDERKRVEDNTQNEMQSVDV